MTSGAKVNVYALENYVISVTATSCNDEQNRENEIVAQSSSNRKIHNKKDDKASMLTSKGKLDGNAKKEQQEQQKVLLRCKTPLEKLISLKARYTLQNSCVISVEGVLLVHAHRHTHILLLKQHVQRRKSVTQSTLSQSTNNNNIDNRVNSNKTNVMEERSTNTLTSSALTTIATTTPAVSTFSTATSIANIQNDIVFRLPGGRCRRGENEDNCLIRKLGRLLLNEPKLPSATNSNTATGSKSNTEVGNKGHMGASASNIVPDTILDVTGETANEHASQASSLFHVGELLAKWYRPHFSPLMYPYIPPHISPTSVKEMRSIYLVHVEPMLYFNVTECMDAELVAVPLFDLYDNAAKYGPIISALPSQLSHVLLEYNNTEYEESISLKH